MGDDSCRVVWVGVVDKEPRGGFEGGAEILEEGDFGFGGADFFIEVLLGVVMKVVGS